MVIYLLLGTNQGNYQQNLTLALELLNQQGIKIVKTSSLYKTQPWGKRDQPDFFNIAVKGKTNLSSRQLIKIIKDIEKFMGRRKTKKWGPRLIDIDIIFYGHKIINQKNLVVPHPLLSFRKFALVPLAEIAPYFRHPVLNKTVLNLLKECKDKSKVKILSNSPLLKGRITFSKGRKGRNGFLLSQE